MRCITVSPTLADSSGIDRHRSLPFYTEYLFDIILVLDTFSQMAHSRDNLTNCLLFLSTMIIWRSEGTGSSAAPCTSPKRQSRRTGAKAHDQDVNLVLTPDCSCWSELRSVSTWLGELHGISNSSYNSLSWLWQWLTLCQSSKRIFYASNLHVMDYLLSDHIFQYVKSLVR